MLNKFSSADAPYCATFARSASLDDESTFLSLTCAASTETILVLATTTNGKGQLVASSTTAAAGGFGRPAHMTATYSTLC